MKLRRAVLVILLLAGASLSFANTNGPDPKILRKKLILALNEQALTDSLYKVLTGEANRSPLLDAYLGVVQALKAKHTWNPYFKVKYLNDAERTLQAAVKREPDNIEIRFVRFSIEHNVPGFLGYNEHLIADRDEIIAQLAKKHYASADEDMVRTIIKFLIESKRCTPEQNQILHTQLAAIK